MVSTGSTVEMYVKKRQDWMRSYLWGVTLWMGSMILRDSFPDRGHLADFTALLGGVGAILWGTAVWRITQLSKQLQNNRLLASALGDELFQTNRLKAAFFAFAMLGLTQMLFLAVLTFVPHLISGLVVAEINMLVACTSFVGAWLYRDQKE